MPCPSHRSFGAVAAVAATVLIVACAGTPPGRTRADAEVLALGSWRRGHLDCSRGDCADWYRIQVEREGNLGIDVYAGSEPATPRFRVTLEAAGGEILESSMPGAVDITQIRRVLEPGAYWLVVEAEGPGDRPLDYELLVRMRRIKKR